MSTDSPRETAKPVGAAPILLLCLIGLMLTLWAAYPGWMSADSLDQYSQARSGKFFDAHPVLMAWWWNKLITVVDGPALMLVQNLVLYWLAWGLIAMAMRRRAGRAAFAIPLVGLWPGILFPLGMVWKDIFYACLMFAAFAVLLNAQASGRRPRWWERILVVALATFAIGVKTNGVTAIPFLMWYWMYVEQVLRGRWVRQVALAVALTLASFGLSALAISGANVVRQPIFQQTQIYDLLGTSLRTGQVLLPPFVTDVLGSELPELAAFYALERQNPIFVNDEGVSTGAYTNDQALLSDLGRRWVGAILAHPLEYLGHRLDHFAAVMRWDGRGPAYVAVATIDPNEWDFTFTPNPLSDFLTSTWSGFGWMYLPWVYAYMLLLSTITLAALRRHVAFAAAMSASAVAFVAPQFFVVPADDYRYFYFAYICAMALAVVAVVELALAFRTQGVPAAAGGSRRLARASHALARGGARLGRLARATLARELAASVGLYFLLRDNGVPRQASERQSGHDAVRED